MPFEGWEVIRYSRVTVSFAEAFTDPLYVSSSLTEKENNPKVKLKGIGTGLLPPPPPPPPQEEIIKISDKKYNFFMYKIISAIKKRGLEALF